MGWRNFGFRREAIILYGGQNGCRAVGYVDVTHYIRWLYLSVKI